MSNPVLPIIEMNDMSLVWGDITVEPKAVTEPEEPPKAVSVSNVWKAEDYSILDTLQDLPKESQMDIASRLSPDVLAKALRKVRMAPAEPAPRATFAQVVGDECAVEAARPVVPETVKSGKVCPRFGAGCHFGSACKHTPVIKTAPVEVTLYVETTTTTTTTDADGFVSSEVKKETTPVVVLMDKNARHCWHDGVKHPFCARAEKGVCENAHRVHADGTLVNTSK
jgi:hypothetical protein